MRLNVVFLPLLVLSSMAASSGDAGAWRCTNRAFEAYCSSEGCVVEEESFTPMDIVVSTEGYVYFCMYAGCWFGEGETLESLRHFSVHAEALAWTPDVNEENERIAGAILVDKDAGVALLSVAAYAQPLSCRWQAAAESEEEGAAAGQ